MATTSDRICQFGKLQIFADHHMDGGNLLAPPMVTTDLNRRLGSVCEVEKGWNSDAMRVSGKAKVRR